MCNILTNNEQNVNEDSSTSSGALNLQLTPVAAAAPDVTNKLQLLTFTISLKHNLASISIKSLLCLIGLISRA